MSASKKWYTCTPVNFTGDDTFFARDSGLLCKGFQELGVDCKAIMPGPAMDTDLKEDLIRTAYQNLEDPDWWRSLNGEGVVFYGWGMAKYAKIAKAIKASGMIFVSHMDTSGMMNLLNGLMEYTASIWRTSIGRKDSYLGGVLLFIARMGYAASYGLIRNELTRVNHFKYADAIGAISPIAMERIKKVCRIYGGDELESKVQLIPHPNASYMRYTPDIPKEYLMIAIGRWDDEKIKGTELLKETCKILLERDTELQIEIYGRRPASLDAWHNSLNPEIKNRFHLKGLVKNIELRKALQRAQVELCTSLSEGYHTVSAEALCCGCSVVGPDIPEIPSMQWFTDGPCGTTAKRDSQSLAAAVLSELEAWKHAQRNAAEISAHWTSILHAPKVAERIIKLTT